MLSRSPSKFTKLIQQFTLGLNDVISYVDDMLVLHSNLSEHLIGVHRLLYRVRHFGLTIQPSKTFVATTEVVFLGYTMRQGTIMPEPSLFKKKKGNIYCCPND